MTGKNGIDAVAVTSAVVSWGLPDYLGMIAAFLSIIWFLIRIWESETVKGLRGKLPGNKP